MLTIIIICAGALLLSEVGCWFWLWREIKEAPTKCPCCEYVGKYRLVYKGEECPTCGWRNE